VLLLGAGQVEAQAPRLGTIDFPTSGSGAAQRNFLQGVLYLHSFEYESAAVAFRKARSADPGFAMAYWGEAMTYTHPIWNQQDSAAARAVLAEWASTPEARRSRVPTARERGYFEAIEALYGEGSKPARDTAYARAMERVTVKFPKDLEAKAFYALALLGLSQGVRNVPTYMLAAAIADSVFRANPNHPGAAHYLIHAFDDPAHAPLGLRAARAYSRIAPDAAHAQHMTTHIFVALGMWDEVVSQNAIAVKLTREVPGHYTSWLNYGLLQQGRYAEATRELEAVRANMGPEPSRGLRSALAWMRAHYVVSTEAWDSPIAGWTIELGDKPGVANIRDRFVQGLAALHRGDRAAAERAQAELEALQSGASGTSDEGDEVAQVGAILVRQLGAALKLGAGQAEGALALMHEATALEDAMPVDFGPPQVIKPSHEMLGEMLLELRQPAASEQEFVRALQGAPRRARSLVGLVRAAVQAGDRPMAERAYQDLRAIWHQADPGLPELDELQKLVAGR
jgi:tetratricopeptide (TPR) repeat protein